MPDKLTLAARIAQASIDVGDFTADKINPEQNYRYISADAVLARGGNALAKNGVSVIPSVTDTMINVVDRGANKSPRQDARVTFCMTITDGEKEVTAIWYGFGSDYSVPDKAVYKAITSGHKYFLMKLLNIGAGNEDCEHEGEPSNDKPARRPVAPVNGKQAAHAAVQAQATEHPAVAKQADIKTANWPAIAARVCQNVPYYTRDGKPALIQILRAAAAEGFSEVTDANAEPIIEALAARVARKSQTQN